MSNKTKRVGLQLAVLGVGLASSNLSTALNRSNLLTAVEGNSYPKERGHFYHSRKNVKNIKK